MVNLRYLLKKKELRFYYVFYFIFVILAFTPRFIDKYYLSNLTNKQKIIIAFTTEDYIDKKFSNLIPYLEPNGMDHFSYTPRRISYLKNIVNKYYGYDLLNENKKVKGCDENFYRSSHLNTCLTQEFWQNLTKNQWVLISNETKVNYVVSRIQLSTLHLCETFINKSDNSKLFYYYISSQKNTEYCYQLNER